MSRRSTVNGNLLSKPYASQSACKFRDESLISQSFVPISDIRHKKINNLNLQKQQQNAALHFDRSVRPSLSLSNDARSIYKFIDGLQ